MTRSCQLFSSRPVLMLTRVLTIIIIIEHPVFRALDIVILAAFHGPDEEEPGTEPERQGEDDKIG